MGQARRVSQLSYAERRLIVVTDAGVPDAKRRIMEGEPSKKVGWADVAAIGLSIVMPFTGALAFGAAIAAEAAAKKMRERGLPVLTISKTEATELQFPIGHPRYKVLYVGHPVVPTSYIPMADFHRFLFEHKVAEAFNLLMSLGAQELEIERISGKSSLGGVSAALPVPIEGITLGTHIERTVGSTSQLLFKANLTPEGNPTIPRGLVWYSHEPLWQSVTTGRLVHGLTSFALDVRYEDDFGVNAGLQAQALQAGLEVGGNFETHQSTVWRMKGTFARI